MTSFDGSDTPGTKRRPKMPASAGTMAIGTYWLILTAFAVVFLVATWAVLVRSTRTSQR